MRTAMRNPHLLIKKFLYKLMVKTKRNRGQHEIYTLTELVIKVLLNKLTRCGLKIDKLTRTYVQDRIWTKAFFPKNKRNN